MIYLDTGCLVKVYYPEPDSASIVSHVLGNQISYTPLHELEFVNALQLKIFSRSATAAQVTAARELVQLDLNSGLLVPVNGEWLHIFQEAVKLAEQYTNKLGCRSLDILHCAAAKVLKAEEFISTDARQKKLAAAIGLNCLQF